MKFKMFTSLLIAFVILSGFLIAKPNQTFAACDTGCCSGYPPVCACQANGIDCSTCSGCAAIGGSDVVGQVAAPPGVRLYGGGSLTGLSSIIGNVLKFFMAIAGVWAVINMILAGYTFMSAGGDPKKLESAWSKIWQTLMGLAVAAGAFVLAAIFSLFIYGNATQLFTLTIYGPN